jgi:Secretion system C-terminal sorting domain
MRKLSLCILLISGTALLYAQTQITSSDVANIYAAGKGFISMNSSDPNTTMNIGSASSSSQNWTVPNITYDDTNTIYNVDPSGTPFFSDFSTATHCQFFSGSESGFSGAFYSYYRLETNAMYSLGSVLQTQFNGKDTTVELKEDKQVFPLPVTYGSLKVIENDTTDLGSGFLYITNITQSVDASGNITFPFGTFPCFRLSNIEETITYFNGIVFSQDTSYSFTWIAKDGGFFEVSIDPSTGASGNVTLASASMVQFTNSPTAVNDGGLNAPASFSLDQNYPNPFNPSTTIRYTVPSVSNGQSNHVTLKVYDVLGNEIATLVNENKPAGIYEVQFSAAGKNEAELPSGIYFYRLTARSFTQTNKMILLK